MNLSEVVGRCCCTGKAGTFAVHGLSRTESCNSFDYSVLVLFVGCIQYSGSNICYNTCIGKSVGSCLLIPAGNNQTRFHNLVDDY